MKFGLYFIPRLLFTTLPYGLFPDSFLVGLKNGTTVVFTTTMLLESGFAFEGNPTIALDTDGNVVLVLDRQAIREFMNQPGQQYAAYIRSIAALPDDFGNPARTRDRRQLDRPRLADDEHRTKLNYKLQDDQDEENPLDQHEYRALDGNVMLYKFDAFNLQPIQVIKIWNNLTNMAIEGVRKSC
ncbi:hypothetical protein ACA910_012345 [Epithemia clementina (nom. ined.)]